MFAQKEFSPTNELLELLDVSFPLTDVILLPGWCSIDNNVRYLASFDCYHFTS